MSNAWERNTDTKLQELEQRIKVLEKQVRDTFIIPRQLLSAKDASEIEFKMINQYETYVREISNKYTETLKELQTIKRRIGFL